MKFTFSFLFLFILIGCGFLFFACDAEEKQVLLPIIQTEQCKATKIQDGYTLKCGDETITVYNGEDGQDGQDGDDASIEVIHVCGNTDGEVLIRLPDSTLVAYYKSDILGTQEYLKVLTPGEYTSSDKYHCHFAVDENNRITYK